MSDDDREWSEYARKRRVFILGAGFSASAGIPMIDTLLADAMALFKKECPGIYERICNYVADIQWANNDEEPNFTSVGFSELCTHLEFVELREYAGGERWSEVGCREKLALKYYLAKSIINLTPEKNAIPSLYTEFASQLHSGDIVITFNWDTLLESAIKAVGKVFTYGFDRVEAIRLYKLHGSLNWRLGRPKRLGKEVNTLRWRPVGLVEGGLLATDFYASDLLLSAATWNQYQPLGELQPFLVLPGYGKAFDVRSIAPLWYRPEFTFAACRDIFVIGLGLSPDDHFIRSFFLNNYPMPDRKTFIINPDVKSEDNYAFMLRDKSVSLISECFSEKHVKLMLERLAG